jgi:hypothetical protein
VKTGVAHLEQQALLWIHYECLGRSDAEKGAVKQVAAGHKGAVALGMRAACIQRPPRQWHLAYGVAARRLKSAKVRRA